MFSKGSRYRNLTESTPIDADGKRLKGKNLRIITPRKGRFFHTVRSGERLDLLAYKYYGSPTKWWQISDANPEFQFPTDLLDRHPVAEEVLSLTHPGFDERFDDLLVGLADFGEVMPPQIDGFDGVNLGSRDFVETTVSVIYDPSTTDRQQILDEIEANGFNFLRSFPWQRGNNTVEAFTFDDPTAKEGWRILVDTLASASGMFKVNSFLVTATIQILYNVSMTKRETIIAQVNSSGFAVLPENSFSFSRVGERIVIPPNQVG